MFPDERCLRWRCRRGMLELDLLLQGFIDSGLQRLTQQERLVFERLLTYPDPILSDMLFNRMQTQDSELAYVIKQIQRSTVSPT